MKNPDERVQDALYVKDRVTKWLKTRHNAEIDRQRSGIRLEAGKAVVIIQALLGATPLHIEASVNEQEPNEIIMGVMRKVNDVLTEKENAN